jgi:aminocarboxymuconate-semialdehyde decarboxylase
VLSIDLHTHIVPREWPDMRERTGYGGWVSLRSDGPDAARMVIDDTFFRAVERNLWDPAVRLEQMDATGVDVQAICTVPVMFNYWARPADGLAWSRLLNDHVAEVVRAHPRRFIGLGTLPLQDPALAIEELERCITGLGLAGVQIGSHINAWNLDAPELVPMFEAAADLGAAVFVHPWEMIGRDRMPRYWLPWLVGMPAETALAMCSVIFSGLLERVPTLRIGFAHGGGSFPGTFGRLQHGFDVRPDLVAVDNPVPPRDYLGRFWVDSLVHDPETLSFIVRLFGEDRVALGSDYPFPLGEAVPGTTIDALPDLGDETRRILRGGAASSFLGVNPASYEAA